MKPFNLEQALAGAPVMFRNGDVVNELFYSKTCLYDQPIISVSGGRISNHNKDGKYCVDGQESECDLFMATVKREGWMIKRKDNNNNLLSTMIFDTEEAAKLALSGDQYEYIKIEWEE